MIHPLGGGGEDAEEMKIRVIVIEVLTGNFDDGILLLTVLCVLL